MLILTNQCIKKIPRNFNVKISFLFQNIVNIKYYNKDNTLAVESTKTNSCENENKISSELVQWAIKYNITHNAFSQLLKILEKKGITGLPINSNILLKAKENEIKVSNVPPGEYVHYGLQKNLETLISSLSEKNLLKSNDIKISIFIDCVPLSIFIQRELWVILGSVEDFPKIIFMIGAYHGNKKPNSSNLFLNKFVEEAKYLCESGLYLNKINYNVTIERVICDAPAKAFILNIKNYKGFSSCTKCKEIGEYKNKKMLFPENSVPRTNQDFENDHLYVKEKTELLKLPNFGIVTNVPIDYMHLVCLGVVKRLISIWISEKHKHFISDSNLSEITENVIQLMPQELSKPSSLFLFTRWKSSEFRQFLLYYAPVLLNYVLKKEYYDHFLALHIACRVFCMTHNNEILINFGKGLLTQFVETLIILYGKEEATYNVHGLYHLAEDYKLHGSLDKFSSFEFENFLLRLRRLMKRCKKKTVHQLLLKQSWQNLFLKNLESAMENKIDAKKKIHLPDSNNVPKCLQSLSQYKILKINNQQIIPETDSEKYVLLKDGSIVEVSSIVYKKINKIEYIYIIGRKFLSVSDYYFKPLKSSLLDIYKVKNLSNVDYWSADLIKKKCMKIPLKEGECVIVGLLEENF